MDPKVAGLTAIESRAWVVLLSLTQALPTELDRRLRPAGLTFTEYGSLIALSEAPARTLKVNQIAQRTLSPLPRTSKIVRRLEARGLLVRSVCPSDSRAFNITLTEAGRRAIVGALRIHAADARELFLDRLTTEQLKDLAEILGPAAVALGPDGPFAHPL